LTKALQGRSLQEPLPDSTLESWRHTPLGALYDTNPLPATAQSAGIEGSAIAHLGAWVSPTQSWAADAAQGWIVRDCRSHPQNSVLGEINALLCAHELYTEAATESEVMLLCPATQTSYARVRGVVPHAQESVLSLWCQSIEATPS